MLKLKLDRNQKSNFTYKILLSQPYTLQCHMGLFEDKDVRMVGLGLIISSVLLMSYEVFQIVFRLHLNNSDLLNADFSKISIKLFAIFPTLVIGLGLLAYFQRVNKSKDSEKKDCIMKNEHKWIGILVLCIVLIITGIMISLLSHSSEPMYFISGSGIITILILIITSQTTKQATDEIKNEFNVKIDDVLKEIRDMKKIDDSEKKDKQS
jgi:hypothetical protein